MAYIGVNLKENYYKRAITFKRQNISVKIIFFLGEKITLSRKDTFLQHVQQRIIRFQFMAVAPCI